MKAYDLKLPTVFAPQQTWHALGDIDRVRHLLSYVPAIGRKRNLGAGTVLEWSVERCEEDCSVAHNGAATRRVPAFFGLEGAPHYGAIRPPYHHRSRRMECVGPCP